MDVKEFTMKLVNYYNFTGYGPFSNFFFKNPLTWNI